MEQRLYVVFDRVAEQSSPVFQATSDAVACRSVRKLFEEVEPYDRNSFQLLCVGAFIDGKRPEIVPYAVPEVVSLEFPRFDDAESAQSELFQEG